MNIVQQLVELAARYGQERAFTKLCVMDSDYSAAQAMVFGEFSYKFFTLFRKKWTPLKEAQPVMEQREKYEKKQNAEPMNQGW